ncbi:MAG: hypothetical protein KIS73_12285 [Enhydrobacter sp.]|nr:hypothetical protein [Enhydrobacter sp.]
MTMKKIALAALCGSTLVSASASATIGGVYYAPQYDYGEFFAAADNKAFRVVLAGSPFSGADGPTIARELLPILQANKPRPALTFTYDVPAERPRPDYRLVLVFNPAPDLGSAAVCSGVMRLQPGQPGLLNVYAVYCRNDQVMSETTGRTQAAGMNDPRVTFLFRELLLVVFSDSPALRPQTGGDRR